jgi:hypothetical protein
MSDEECRRIGANARRWFVSNKEGFANRVEAALQTAISLQGTGQFAPSARR